MPSTEIDSITAQVLRSAVHDLAGPANRVRLTAQLLARTCAALDADARKLLGYLEESASAVSVTADGIRRYTEICGREWTRQAVDLNACLASATGGMRAEMESVGAEVASGRLPVVCADPVQMSCLFQELLTNAVRFRSGTAPQIHVSSSTGGPGSWCVSVADNGPGIEPEMAERIFQPFKKISEGPGAGLGLTICRKIVELHEGRLWLEPRERGAEFRFYLGGAVVGGEG
jgi:signal transduction histidine kinase